MSMISGQVDRLRTAAQTYRRLGNHSAESMLLDAADTIWELRDDLQRANAENEKLRKLCSDIWYLFTEHGAVNPCDLPVVDAVRDRMRELGVEVSE